MSDREPQPGDTVWLKPGKIMAVSEDSTGAKHYNVEIEGHDAAFYVEGEIERFEPAVIEPEPQPQSQQIGRRDLIAAALLSCMWRGFDVASVRYTANAATPINNGDASLWGDYLKASYRIADVMIEEEHRP